eukprot:15430319-Alexandrium_andersonii.AAC.1
MAGGTGVEAPSGAADAEVVAGSARAELARSAETFVEQLVASANERGETLVKEITKVANAAL